MSTETDGPRPPSRASLFRAYVRDHRNTWSQVILALCSLATLVIYIFNSVKPARISSLLESEIGLSIDAISVEISRISSHSETLEDHTELLAGHTEQLADHTQRIADQLYATFLLIEVVTYSKFKSDAHEYHQHPRYQRGEYEILLENVPPNVHDKSLFVVVTNVGSNPTFGCIEGAGWPKGDKTGAFSLDLGSLLQDINLAAGSGLAYGVIGTSYDAVIWQRETFSFKINCLDDSPRVVKFYFMDYDPEVKPDA